MIQARLVLHYAGQDRAALDLDVSLPPRGVTAIFGPSGAGKTSLLRWIAGLEPAPGELRIDGERWQGEGFSLPAHRRPVGFVFQEASLFTHLSARGNLRYAQRRARGAAADWDRVVALLGLASLLDRYPHQLSGGERQRVAIGRALLIRPRLLLLDEPLASLDAAHRQEILPYLDQLHATLDLPILYVSHSLDEVARLSDHLLVLAQGRVSAQGPTLELLPQLQVPPGEEAGVVLQATVCARDDRWQLLKLCFAGGELWALDDGARIGQSIRVRILARDVSISRDSQTASSILNRLPAQLQAIEEGTAQAFLRLQLGDSLVLARITRRSVAELGLAVGDRCWAQIKSVAVIR